MELIRFRAQIRDKKGYYTVAVPKTYIDNGYLKKNEEYEFQTEVNQ